MASKQNRQAAAGPLNRRHDDQFSAHSPDQQRPHNPQVQPRRVPNPSLISPEYPSVYANRSATRQPSVRVEELPDEPNQQQQPPPPAPGMRFNPTNYSAGRNVPGGHPQGQQGPPHPGHAAFRPNQQRAFTPQGQGGPAGPQGPAGGQRDRLPLTKEQQMQMEYKYRMAEAARGGGQPGQTGPPIPGAHTRQQSGQRPPQPRPPQQGQGPLRKGDGPSAAQDDSEVLTFGSDQAITSIEAVNKPAVTGGDKRGATSGAMVVKELIQLQKPPLPPVPTGHFIVAKELLSPSSIPCSVNQGQLWANSLRSHATARGERLASKDEDKKHLQWDVVSDAFANQQGGLEGTMSFYNTLIERFNNLAEIKNTHQADKEDLTDRYRRAGAHFSTACVSLQTSTHQVRLPETKKRRLITDGSATQATQATQAQAQGTTGRQWCTGFRGRRGEAVCDDEGEEEEEEEEVEVVKPIVQEGITREDSGLRRRDITVDELEEEEADISAVDSLLVVYGSSSCSVS
ncbi:uncharacterized protein MKK02DRAFT_28075 [Dioszegia hungarica]|uniref:Uncharacterized protein n=1 Tax=Dioszegia hungarica TaxID=4972 RepID=A0AA38LV97_9TREE|nr:uncharacterized protein MKK02DRAFT_28075 [Dioszegia hungarica]KAI9634966.1 hypothetical protein MKK02DRAFT_28075 [Dioszegia hungarica]